MKIMSVDVNKLSSEERAKLMEQLQAQENARKNEIKKEREEYRDLVNKVVGDTAKDLETLSSLLSQYKADVYKKIEQLLKRKKEIYGYRDGQQTHSFTDKSGYTIEVGFRVIDSWDDTVEAGIAKVKEYIDSLSTNEETARLVRIIQGFLKKDKKGDLKPSRVLELQKLANDINDPDLTEAVDIIKDAYHPNRSAFFIEASYKDKAGERHNIPLSITTVDFPEGTDINFDEL